MSFASQRQSNVDAPDRPPGGCRGAQIDFPNRTGRSREFGQIPDTPRPRSSRVRSDLLSNTLERRPAGYFVFRRAGGSGWELFGRSQLKFGPRIFRHIEEIVTRKMPN